MSRLHATQLKLVGATSAALLIAGAAAAPAMAAGEETASATYSCFGGLVSITAAIAVDAPPATLVAGQTKRLAATGNVVIDAPSTKLAQDFYKWKSVDGTITTPLPTTPAGLDMTVDLTTLGNQPDGSTLATPHGSMVVKPTQAGTYTLALGDFRATLQGYDASGATIDNPSPIDCGNAAGPVSLKDSAGAVATIKVNKDTTKTATSAAYSGTKHVVKGKAKVKSHFGLKATGKVKFQLLKGTHKIASVKAKVNAKGIAKAVFKNITKKGKYTVKAAYLGNKALKGSKGSTTVKVG